MVDCAGHTPGNLLDETVSDSLGTPWSGLSNPQILLWVSSQSAPSFGLLSFVGSQLGRGGAGDVGAQHQTARPCPPPRSLSWLWVWAGEEGHLGGAALAWDRPKWDLGVGPDTGGATERDVSH